MSFFDGYDPPIHATFSNIKMSLQTEYGRTICRAVGQIGIDINEEGLEQALNNDKKRYEEAYHSGWADCEKQYKDDGQALVNMMSMYLKKNPYYKLMELVASAVACKEQE